MTNILDIPSELIASVLPYLDNEDIFNIRLANKHLERSALSYFGTHFFRKKGYLITTPSINVFKSIAAHEELRKYVQHVWFNPDLYTFLDPACADPEYEDFPWLSEKEDAEASLQTYYECKEDHYRLLIDGELENELRIAFANLPNLQAVGMRRSEDHSPWGWQRLKDVIGEDPRLLRPIPSGPVSALSGPTYLFLAIVNALAATNVGIKRLYTDAIEVDNIRPDHLDQEKLDNACRSLLYLEINASKSLIKAVSHPESEMIQEDPEYGEGLLTLFRAVPNLLELGLQIFPDRKYGDMIPPSSRDPESWRQAYAYITFEKLASNIQLSNLTRLKLEMITTSPDILTAFLNPSQSCLASFKMRDMRLLSTEDNKRPWQTIFSFLQLSCPKLSYILLYHLMHKWGGISFAENPPTPIPYNETQDMDGAPNPPHGEPAGGELFTPYDDIALEVSGRAAVEAKLGEIVERHWYDKPIFSYDMDDSLWHTDTSDEEW